MHLLSAVLEVNAGGTAAFADTYLLRPLGIRMRGWELDNRGIPNGGAGLYLRPRDIAKLGSRCRKEVAPVTLWWSLRPGSTRRRAGRAGIYDRLGALGAVGYGDLWWLGGVGGNDVVLGWGYGGQLVYIVPGLDLVVVTTARWQGLGGGVGQQTTAIANLIVDRITPAVHSAGGRLSARPRLGYQCRIPASSRNAATSTNELKLGACLNVRAASRRAIGTRWPVRRRYWRWASPSS